MLFWACFAGPIAIIIYKCVVLDMTLAAVHASGCDIILLGLCFISIVIRSFVIGAKYATFSEKQYRAVNE